MTWRPVQSVAMLALVLASCSPAPELPPAPPTLRDTTAPLGSQVGVTAAGISDRWIVRQVLPGNSFRPGPALGLEANGPDLRLIWDGVGCSDAVNLCESFSGNVAYSAAGPGRWVRKDEPGRGTFDAPAAIWVFWTDSDRRTMALGDPAGTFAMILDRSTSGGADRILAAREILDWYGFETSQLIDISQ